MSKTEEVVIILQNEVKRVTKKANILEYDNFRLIEQIESAKEEIRILNIQMKHL